MKQRFLIAFLFLYVINSGVEAQNVTNYSSMAEPLLFLLREPAVHDDLKLKPRQKKELLKFNQRHDAALLSSRNMPSEKATEKTNAVLNETREQLTKILSVKQRQRLNQIRYRIRGISFVLVPDAAEKIGLSNTQKEKITRIVEKTKQTLASLQKEINNGDKTQPEAEKIGIEARKNEQSQILAVLDATQKNRLVGLVGSSFDVTKLGRVSFLIHYMAIVCDRS